MGRTQNTHTESKKVKLITEMIRICVFTFFFCYIAGRHFLIQTEDRGEDYSATDTDEPSKLHGTGAKEITGKGSYGIFPLFPNKNSEWVWHKRRGPKAKTAQFKIPARGSR